jgi:tRNA (cmo5U34)-methyltransferase
MQFELQQLTLLMQNQESATVFDEERASTYDTRAAKIATSAYQSLREVWTRMLKYAGYPDEEVEKFLTAHGRNAAVLPLSEVASIIALGGFDAPVLFLQALFIHAWYARRA